MTRRTHSNKTMTEVFVHPDSGKKTTTQVKVRTEQETARLHRLIDTLPTEQQPFKVRRRFNMTPREKVLSKCRFEDRVLSIMAPNAPSALRVADEASAAHHGKQ